MFINFKSHQNIVKTQRRAVVGGKNLNAISVDEGVS